MALQSQIGRIETAILQKIAPDVLTSDAMKAFIYSVLEYEMVKYVSESYAVEDMVLSFRTAEGAAENWRVQTNVAFSDYLKAEDPGVTGVLETLPLDMTGKQVAILYLSREFDAGGGGVCYWDANLDADDDDLTAGEYLTADRGLVLEWDAIYPVDIYVTRKIVFRLRLDGAGKLYSVRVRMAVVGSLARLSQDVEVVALFCAARHFEYLLNKAIKGNSHPDTIKALTNRIAQFQNKALGILGLGDGKVKAVGGAAGGSVKGTRPVNPWSDKILQR